MPTLEDPELEAKLLALSDKYALEAFELILFPPGTSEKTKKQVWEILRNVVPINSYLQKDKKKRRSKRKQE